MSSLSYYKMMIIGNRIKKQVTHAKSVCAKKPRSHECRVEWEKVNEIHEMFDMCKSEHLIELEKQVDVEIPWEP